jgi:hypothetical protein
MVGRIKKEKYQDTHSEVQALPIGTRSNNVNHSVMFVSLTVSGMSTLAFILGLYRF